MQGKSSWLIRLLQGLNIKPLRTKCMRRRASELLMMFTAGRVQSRVYHCQCSLSQLSWDAGIVQRAVSDQFCGPLPNLNLPVIHFAQCLLIVYLLLQV